MLSIQHIVKEYSQHKALDNVSIEIEKGEIFGLLGPNGAGKTSLIRIINQITASDEGIILFNGEKLQQKHIAQIGYLPEERGLYKKMEIGEQVLYLAQLKGMKKTETLKKLKYWFEKMEMENWWNKKVEDLSKGMQQKVQFVATVIHEPELIILDEPFSGFDPVNAETIKNEILELNKNGSTIIFSTHRMESVEQLCHSIALIHKAKKILDGKVQDIRNAYKDNSYKVIYSGAVDILIQPKTFTISQMVNKENTVELYTKLSAPYNTTNLLTELMQYGQIQHFEELIPSMNDIFIQKVKQTNS
ncbi:ABC transporter ATP-binding protein [Pseudopedobacter beijingensis]|uniref:ABC transporter ATP-binding protein n=1 Tax=Pseudopedobacter beijingensis TaxID=1207056 RepID=A0ABW4IBT1_9SPHI